MFVSGGQCVLTQGVGGVSLQGKDASGDLASEAWQGILLYFTFSLATQKGLGRCCWDRL